jgi:hypothetical protein
MIKNDLILKSPLEFPRKNYDGLSMLIESKRNSNRREKKNGGHKFKLQTHKQKNPKDFNGY